ncbi:MAG: hypothetical protein WC802_04065 [Patescibacteria group bacterium]|jgi:hypothetical protein
MKCPICNYDMHVESTRTTYDASGRKAYDWSKQMCKRDDVWIELETPQKEQE